MNLLPWHVDRPERTAVIHELTQRAFAPYAALARPSGALAEEWTYHVGVLEGPYRSYHTDGGAWVLGEYRGGLRSGLWLVFRPDGSVDADASGYFEEGELVRPLRPE